MRIKFEDEILDEEVRKKIIEDIEASENRARKQEAYRRHQIFKDNTKDFVRERLLKLLDPTTVAEMEYCMANVSIAKKIIDKLARVYSNGVERSLESEEMTDRLDRLARELKSDLNLKTLNKILKLQKNALLYVKPVYEYDKNKNKKWRPMWLPMSPYLYDVVEHESDRTKGLVYVLSNYEHPIVSPVTAQLAAVHRNSTAVPLRGNRKDESIADKKEDEDIRPDKSYIWWSDSYHFTTMGSKIINMETGLPAVNLEIEKIENPIGEIPFVDMHIDQEGSYWAEGGLDLIEAAILINCMITNAHHIGVTQGYGQLVITGSNIPQSIKLGPNKMIGLPQESNEDPTPSAQFITASPPLADLQNQIEMYIALLLTTNNLSTSGISANLQGGVMAPSGVALAIDKAESLEDVQDQREMFRGAEGPAWRKTTAWMHYFSANNELDETYQELLLPENEEPSIEFKDSQIIMSEAEKLDNIKRRQEMNINTQIELIMKDRNVSRQDAEIILKEILEEKIENQIRSMEMIGAVDADQEDDSLEQ